MRRKDPRVDACIEMSRDFAKPILTRVRDVVHDACPEAEETLKWGFSPFNYKGILCSMAAFKEHWTLNFWKGEDVLGAGVASGGATGQLGRLSLVKALPSKKVLSASVMILLITAGQGAGQATKSGNPILPGWYADPEAHVFAGEYWIYPTTSAPYDVQTYLDAFSSPDLVEWKRHPRVLNLEDVAWGTRALWAPSVVEKDGWYYLFFSANDIQSDEEGGGIGVARSRDPGGPFEDYLGKPLIGRFHNGAQPIDPFVFPDATGVHYLIYGGWRHCNIAKLNDDFTGFLPFEDGATFREITPEGYVEGSFMLLRDGRYYFMWSEGGWTGPDYAVAYAVAPSPTGPFQRIGRILQQDPEVATGAGHHSVLHVPGADKWYIVYHRRPLGETDRNHRVVCIDELRFNPDGRIVPVRITLEGVKADPLR
jgi:hypothetical protein